MKKLYILKKHKKKKKIHVINCKINVCCTVADLSPFFQLEHYKAFERYFLVSL